MRRILHFMADIHVSSGMAAVVMNYYRHIDRSRVQFDFLYFEDGPLTYAQEIESLGGRVFLIPRPGPSSMGAIREFFREHQGEFSVLHCHPIWSAAVLEPVARRFGIRAVFLHSHSDKQPMVLDINHTPHIANDGRILRYAKLAAAGAPRLGVKAERVCVNGIRQNMYRGRDAHQRRFRGV